MKRCSSIKYSNMQKFAVRLFDMSIRRLDLGAGLFLGSLLLLQLVTHAQTAAKPTIVKNEEVAFTRYLQPAVFSLSKIMMHDVVNPPAAARYYAYCMLGAYEILSQHDTTLTALPNLLKQY